MTNANWQRQTQGTKQQPKKGERLILVQMKGKQTCTASIKKVKQLFKVTQGSADLLFSISQRCLRGLRLTAVVHCQEEIKIIKAFHMFVRVTCKTLIGLRCFKKQSQYAAVSLDKHIKPWIWADVLEGRLSAEVQRQ